MVFARIAALVWLGLAPIAHGAGGSCDRVGSRCQCTDSDGDIWDLTELSGDHQVTGPGSSIWTFEYHFNFCANVAPPTASTCNFQSTNAYRVEDYTGTSPICLRLGSDHALGNIQVSKINGAAANGVKIKFHQENPTSGSFTVDLQCDGTTRGVATQPNPPAYQTEATTVWPTFYTCPDHQNRIGDWGIPLLIMVAVSGVLYAGAGYGYNYKMKGGEISHPHAEQWRSAMDNGPRLVMDGIFFTRCQLSKVGFLSFLGPSDEARRHFDSEKHHLMAGDGETSAEGRTSKDKRRKDSKDKDKRSKSSKKDSKKDPKKDRRDSKGKVAIEPAAPAPVREIKEVARVVERVMDIEIAEGNIKE